MDTNLFYFFIFFPLRLTTPVELRRVLKVFVTTFFCITFNYPCWTASCNSRLDFFDSNRKLV